MDEKTLKLLERALAENLTPESVSYIMKLNGYDQSSVDLALEELKKKRPEEPSQQTSTSEAVADSGVSASATTQENGQEASASAAPSPVELPEGLKSSIETFRGERSILELSPAEQKARQENPYEWAQQNPVTSSYEEYLKFQQEGLTPQPPVGTPEEMEKYTKGEQEKLAARPPQPASEMLGYFAREDRKTARQLNNIATSITEDPITRQQAEDVNAEISNLVGKKVNIFEQTEEGMAVPNPQAVEELTNYSVGLMGDAENRNSMYLVDKAKWDANIDPNTFAYTSTYLKAFVDPFVKLLSQTTDSPDEVDAVSDVMRYQQLKNRYSAGLEDVSFSQSIAEGDLGQAWKQFVFASAENVPGMIYFVANPYLGYGYTGVRGGTEAYDEYKNRLDLSITDKSLLVGGAAAADIVMAMAFEKIGLGDIKLTRQALGILPSEVGTKLARNKALQFLSNSTKAYVGEFAEEGSVSLINQSLAYVIAGEEFNWREAWDEALLGGFMGASNVNVANVLGAGARGLASRGRMKEFTGLVDEAAKLNDAISNPEITDAERNLIQNRLNEIALQQTEITRSSIAVYEGLNEKDQSELLQVHDDIKKATDLYKKATDKTAKSLALASVKKALDAKAEIESRYDSKTQTGLRGDVQEGKVSREVPKPGTGTQKAAPGRVVQEVQNQEIDQRFHSPSFEVDGQGRPMPQDPAKSDKDVFQTGAARETGKLDAENAAELNRVFGAGKQGKVVVHHSLESLINETGAAIKLYLNTGAVPKAYAVRKKGVDGADAVEYHVMSRKAYDQYNKATGKSIDGGKQYIHEMVHPLLWDMMSLDTEVEGRLFEQIKELADSGNTVAKRAINFGKLYTKAGTPEKIQNETVTEFFALVANKEDFGKFDATFKQKVKAFFNELLARLGVDVKIETDQDLFTMANNIKNAVKYGREIRILPTTNAQYQQRSVDFSIEEGTTPAGSKLFNEPLEAVQGIIEKYVTQKGIDYRPGKKITSLDKDRAKRIADAYDRMEHNPKDPQVKKAYEAMISETVDQYNAIVEEGYFVEINNNEPYNSSQEMIEDLRDNQRMKIFSTESGFGDTPITDEQRAENPLLRDSGLKDVNGQTLLVNDLFRFVHDFFGHAERGNGFGPVGEENAWDAHSRMYSPEARKAMTSETRGQNSWVNFSGVNEDAFKLRDKARRLRKEGRYEEAKEVVGQVYEVMKFAEQKIGILPNEFVMNEYDEQAFSLDEDQTAFGAAPYRAMYVESIPEATDKFNDAGLNEMIADFTSVVEAFGGEVVGVEKTIGGWFDSDIKKVTREISFRPIVTGLDQETITAIGAITGKKLAKDVQDGVMIVNPNPASEGIEMEFKATSEAAAEELMMNLHKQNVNNFTLQPKNNTFVIAAQEDADIEILWQAVNSNIKKGLIDERSVNFVNADITFPSSQEYGQILEEYQRNRQDDGTLREDLNKLIQETIDAPSFSLDDRLTSDAVEYPKSENVVLSVTQSNEKSTFNKIDAILEQFPNPLTNESDWNEIMSRVVGKGGRIPIRPAGLVRMAQSVEAIVKELEMVSEGQRKLASAGLAGTKEIGELYAKGKMDETDTGMYFLWNIMSIGISPYPQEAGFLRAVDGGIEKFIEGAKTGKFDLDAYYKWVDGVLPKGTAGSGSKANLRAFGSRFLAKSAMRIEGGEFDGLTRLEALHQILSDRNTPTLALRRKWHAVASGMSFNNKIFDFVLLTTGRSDLFVIDRVRVEHFWDAENLKKEKSMKPGTSIYDGKELVYGASQGAGFSRILNDVPGLVINEIATRALQPLVQEAYARLGVTESPDVGRFHWETWVAMSSQEVSHGSIDAIVQRKKDGDIVDAGIRQGKYGEMDYGFTYRKRSGKDFVYEFIAKNGDTYILNNDGMQALKDEIQEQNSKKTYDGKIARFILLDEKGNIIKRKTGKTESLSKPWYGYKGVNQDIYEQTVKSFATEIRTASSESLDQTGVDFSIDFSTDEGIDFAGIDMKVQERPANTNAKIPTGGIAYVPVSTLYNLMDMRKGREEMYESTEDKKRVEKLVEAFKKDGFEYKGSDALYVDIDVDGYGWIGEGNHRVLAAKQLGMTHLPVRVEFGAARDGKSLYGSEDATRVPTQVISKDKIKDLKKQAGPHYHIKYASIWETDLPTNKLSFSTDEGINWYVSPEGKGDPAISRRDNLLEEAAQDLKAGRLKNYEFREMAKGLSPIEPITRFFAPATTERMEEALDKNKRPSLNKPIKDGEAVALRLDIPAYTKSNTWVVSVHDGKKTDGKIISYRSVARITDVVFKSNPLAALNIAGGEAKNTIGRMFGKYKNLEGDTPEAMAEDAKSIVSKIRNDKSWAQIGMNPTRASYFYDRKSGRPVVAAEEVVQIGGLVYAKNPVYTRWNDPAFEVKGYNDVDGAPIYFSIDESNPQGKKLRNTAARTLNRFSDETRARVLSNPEAYYTPQSVKAIKENLELMSDDELLENMTAEGLNRIAMNASPGKGENDISVLAAVELINRKSEAGEDVSELLVDLAKLGTTVGRMLRHFAELKSSSPQGIVEVIRAALNRADRMMTPTQEQRLTDIADRFIKAQQKVKGLMDDLVSEFSAEKEAELIEANKDLDKVTRELNKFTSVIIPKKTADLLTTTIQGNLLTPMSQVTNVVANVAQIGLSIPVRIAETTFGKFYQLFTNKQLRSFKASVTAVPYALKRAGFGVYEALDTIARGGATSEKIVHSGFMPGAAFLASLSNTKFAEAVNAALGKEVIKGDVLPRLANGKISPADRAKALYEGTLGIPAEVMFRFLALGDKPFYRFAEAMQLSQEADKLNLRGEARKNFMKYPSKKAQKAAEEQAKRLTFQQDNKAANTVFEVQKAIGRIPGVGKALEFMLKVSLPYVKTPANIFTETMIFAIPGFGFARGTTRIFKGNAKEGVSDMAKAAVGQMVIMATNQLIANGLIKGAFSDEDDEERALGYLQQPPNTINIDGIIRYINGENTDWQPGDRLRRYDKLGIAGMVMGARVTAVKNNLSKAKGKEEGYYVGDEKGMFEPFTYVWDQLGVPLATFQYLNQQSFLSGSSSLLKVLSGGASERDVEDWLESTFRALTAIPLPNTLSALNRGQREYMPDMKTKNAATKFKYVIMDRLFDTDGIPVRVDFLGNKIPQTPEGAQKWMYNMFDPTKGMESSKSPIIAEIYRLYEMEENSDVIPSFPGKLKDIPTTNPFNSKKIVGWDADQEEAWRLRIQDIRISYGQEMNDRLERLFASDRYNTASNERKQEMVADLISDLRSGRKPTLKAPVSGMPSIKRKQDWMKEYEQLEKEFFKP